MDNTALKENMVVGRTNQGVEIRAEVLRLTRHLAVFEIHNPASVLQLSEALAEFKILRGEQTLYSGRAVVASLVHTGATLVCEVTLDEAGLNPAAIGSVADPARVRAGFEEFTRDWGKSYRIHPDFKVLVADMHNYLYDLRLWFEQVELGLRSAPPGERPELERRALLEVVKPMVPALNGLFGKFESVAAGIRPEDKPAHRLCVRRQIHPLVFCAPFAYRTFHKPLGYAGDYEMVNMIIRDPFEGSSLFARALNYWFITQPPAEAHRNRIKYLTQKLIEETARVASRGGTARVYNLGCGPAGEIQRYLADHPVCEHTDFTLLDFNDETLAYTTGVLNDLKRRHKRSTPIRLVKKSVAQVLKGRSKAAVTAPEAKYDFIYCAGLFDYLPDALCRQLMNIFYDQLAPGGLLVSTNVDASNPIQEMLDYVLQWVLIYRNGRQMRTLAPDAADPDLVNVCADVTSVNIYLEVRKPAA